MSTVQFSDLPDEMVIHICKQYGVTEKLVMDKEKPGEFRQFCEKTRVAGVNALLHTSKTVRSLALTYFEDCLNLTEFTGATFQGKMSDWRSQSIQHLNPAIALKKLDQRKTLALGLMRLIGIASVTLLGLIFIGPFVVKGFIALLFVLTLFSGVKSLQNQLRQLFFQFSVKKAVGLVIVSLVMYGLGYLATYGMKYTFMALSSPVTSYLILSIGLWQVALGIRNLIATRKHTQEIALMQKDLAFVTKMGDKPFINFPNS